MIGCIPIDPDKKNYEYVVGRELPHVHPVHVCREAFKQCYGIEEAYLKYMKKRIKNGQMNTDLPFGDSTAVAPDILKEFKGYLKANREGVVQEDLSMLLLPNSQSNVRKLTMLEIF